MKDRYNRINEEDPYFYSSLSEVIGWQVLDYKNFVLAQTVLDEGLDVISDEEFEIFETCIYPSTQLYRCMVCRKGVLLAEVFKNGGMCWWCAHNSESD